MSKYQRRSSISSSTGNNYSSPLTSQASYGGRYGSGLFTDDLLRDTRATVIDFTGRRGRPAVYSTGSSRDLLSDEYNRRHDIPPSASRQAYETPKQRSNPHSRTRTASTFNARDIDSNDYAYKYDRSDPLKGKVKHVRGTSVDRHRKTSRESYDDYGNYHSSSEDDYNRGGGGRPKSKRRDSFSSSFGGLGSHDAPRLSRAYTAPVKPDPYVTSSGFGSSNRSSFKSFNDDWDRPSRSRNLSPEPAPRRTEYKESSYQENYHEPSGPRGKSKVSESRAPDDHFYSYSRRAYTMPAAPSPPQTRRDPSPPPTPPYRTSRPPESNDRHSYFSSTGTPRTNSASRPKLRRRGNFQDYVPQAQVETASEIGGWKPKVRERVVPYDQQSAVEVEEID